MAGRDGDRRGEMRFALILVSGCFLLASQASAVETITYSYDALGRLTGSVTSGGPNSGVSTGTSFDPAGNRSSYSVTGSTAARDADFMVQQHNVPTTDRKAQLEPPQRGL